MTSATIEPLLRQALAALTAGRHAEAATIAAQALAIDARSGLAWHITALSREAAGDYPGALEAYEAANTLSPDQPEIGKDLARLALRMGAAEAAEGLLTAYLAQRPDAVDAINNLAIAQRDQMKFDEAIATLQAAIPAHPLSAMLWNTLGSVLTLQGDAAQALVFYDEALRLEPDRPLVRYNRATAQQMAGIREALITQFDVAIAGVGVTPDQLASMKVARAKALLFCGELAAGWAAYDARLDPNYADSTDFIVDAPAGRNDMDLAGKTLLLIGEQGLGDEVMFGNDINDVIEALGPAGRLILAVEPRLVPLFARAFPKAEVGPHASGRVGQRNRRGAPFLAARMGEVDAWAPMAQPLARFRSTLDSFTGAAPYLTPDPARVDHWRGVLKAAAGGRRTVGVGWKSLIMDAERSRYFAPFDAWAPILRAPGVRFVNLQYGDSAAEVARAAAAFEVELWTPPGIDLQQDLDDLTALCVALDLVIGPANATTNLAGAAGANLWLISTPGAWTQLGTNAYPWYPQARAFTPASLTEWPGAMDEVASALRDWL